MKFSSPIKRKKLEIKPVKLSYYNHTSDQKSVINPVPRKYRSAIKIIAVFLLIGSLIPLIYYVFTKYRLLQITEIKVYGPNNYVQVNQVKGYLENKILGSFIITFHPEEYSQAITKEFLGIEKTSISKKYPNKLIVNVIERSPVAVLVTSDQKYLVDKEGYVMQIYSDKDSEYPEIIYSEKITEGQFINQSIVPLSVELLKNAKETNLVINKMQFNSQYITLNINDNIEVDLSLADNTALAMRQVSAIIQKTLLESQKLRKVDLRFEKVIVLYD